MFSEGRGVIVYTTTLDELLKDEVSIDCIKIDAEGAELEILKGAKSILRRTKCLAIEVTRNIRDVVKELEEAGFKCKRGRIISHVLCKRIRDS